MTTLPWQALQRSSPHAAGSPWKLGYKISKGAFGVVYVAADDDDIAIKVGRNVSSVMGECLAEECRLRHKNLLLIEQVSATRQGAFVRMHLVAGEELFYMVGKVSDHCMMKVLKGLISATSYLHGRGYVHRDIKPENVIVSSNYDRVVLVDLGCLKKIGERTITRGTRFYQAPEAKGTIFQIVTTALDDWSVGATIATVATGRLINTSDACLRSLKRKYLYAKPTTRCILESVSDMFKMDPSERLSARRLNARFGVGSGAVSFAT